MDVQLSIEVQKAHHAVGAISMRGYDIPKTVTDANACVAQLETIITAPPQLPPLAQDPKKLRASLTQFAADSRAHTDMLTAAEAARPHLATSVLSATRAAVPGWITDLAGDFAKAWHDFTAVHLIAPTYIDSSFTDEQATAHMQLLRAVSTLDQILSIRVVLGTLLHEEGCDPRNVLLAAALPPVPRNPSTVETARTPIGNLTDHWTGGGPILTTGTRPSAEGVDKWAALTTVPGLTVSLADIHALEVRTNHRGAWTEAVSAFHARGGMPYPSVSREDNLWHDMAG